MSHQRQVAMMKGEVISYMDAPTSFGNDTERSKLAKSALFSAPAVRPNQQPTRTVVASPKRATAQRPRRDACIILLGTANADQTSDTDDEAELQKQAAASLPESSTKDILLHLLKQQDRQRAEIKDLREEDRVLKAENKLLNDRLTAYTTSDAAKELEEFGTRLMVVNMAVQVMSAASNSPATAEGEVKTIKLTKKVSSWADRAENKAITGGSCAFHGKLEEMRAARNADIHPGGKGQLLQAVAKLKEGGVLQGWVKEKEPLACHILLAADTLLQ